MTIAVPFMDKRMEKPSALLNENKLHFGEATFKVVVIFTQINAN
jgi:hypothetical protein